VKFGIAFANIGPFVDPERACALARSAEEAGFESIWTVDHVVVPSGYRSTYPYDPSGRLPSGEDAPFPDPLIWLAYVARATSTIRLATGILILPQRNPLILAKELATLDYLSSGRVTLGVGIGWLKEEFEALGIPFDKRGQRTEESIAAMRALWSEDRASAEGATVGFRHVYLRPQPPGGTIPIHIGGHSEVAAHRAGRIGDGFFPFGVDRHELQGLVATVHRAAEDAGRHPSSVELTVSSYSVDRDQAVAEIEALRALGAGRVVVPAALFGNEPDVALRRYGDDVIGRCSA
jgi:probable F420-dependent oxidoreductase